MTARVVKHNIWVWAKHYSYGCFSKSWNSAIAAIYAYVGNAVGSTIAPQVIQAPQLLSILYVFAVVFSIQVLGWCKDNPIPSTLDEYDRYNPPGSPRNPDNGLPT